MVTHDSSASQQASVAQFVDGLVGLADDIKVDDLLVTWRVDDVHDASEEWLGSIAGDDDCTRPNSFRLGCIAEKRPYPAGFVDLVHVGREGHGHIDGLAHNDLPVKN